MDRPFSDDDRDKTVVTSDGHTVGRVRDVNEDRATIDRSDDDDGLTDKVKDMLGWSDDDDSHELRREHIDREEDDRLFLSDRR
ncbi:hypothetical protein [Halopelagius longus]|uniref:PRC-barrel domain containing protein n=1 Tax=Halopelagius longus TaxID=1236180 RepID=A0A1H1E4C5_9EURY|nr:hypothetical protein [Halopelagius longus]RDI71597.1 hypothetical protein DWB78_07585 [Halopelagius longus]SDQ83460.1 hypothetical protein SAMN05216278_2724 [Halopelagius longus]